MASRCWSQQRGVRAVYSRLASRSRQPSYSAFVSSHAQRSQQLSSTLYYLQRRGEYEQTKPYYINVPAGGLPGHEHTNEVSEPYDGIFVQDIRNHLHEYHLDRNGFQVVKDIEIGGSSVLSCLKADEYQETDAVLRAVGPAVERLLCHTLGAEVAITFAFRLRRRDALFPARTRGADTNFAQPVQGVHVDFTPNYAYATACQLISNRGLSLINRRWQIISVWRPLFGPLQDWPLALLDARSLDPHTDLIASDNVYPHEVRETYNVFRNPNHDWRYLSGQQADELFFFKAFESNLCQGLARVCPHAAFKDPRVGDDVRPRQSVECLSVVLYSEGSSCTPDPNMLLPSETFWSDPEPREIIVE